MAPRITFRDRCCNPFGLTNHKKTKNLRKITEVIQKRWKLAIGVKICYPCRQKLNSKMEAASEDTMPPNNDRLKETLTPEEQILSQSRVSQSSDKTCTPEDALSRQWSCSERSEISSQDQESMEHMDSDCLQEYKLSKVLSIYYSSRDFLMGSIDML